MYFDNCKDKNEVKAMYRKLAMKYHPDRGGDDETMAAINAEYEEAFKRVAAKDWKGTGMHEGGTVDFSDLDDGFREVVLEKIMNIEDIFVELCGSWSGLAATRVHTGRSSRRRAASGHRSKRCGTGGRTTARSIIAAWASKT